MSNAETTSPPTKQKLILHFDIRNTVLVADSVTNVTVGQALNSYLTSVAWGKVDEATNQWSWLPDPVPSIDKPCPEAISYYKYMEKIVVHKPMDRVRFRTITGDFAHRETGKQFRGIYEKHLKLLQYPHEAHSNFSMRGSDDVNYHYILPSFFNLLDHLCSVRDEGEMDFHIVFRTYGLDAPTVLKATDLMLKGEHPDYPKNYQCTIDHRRSRIVRSFNYIHLHSVDGSTINEETSIYQALSNPNTTVMGVMDDFHWWMGHDYKHEAGKPLWLYPNEKEVIHIFFDDNIRPQERDNIVDVRLWRDAGFHSLALPSLKALEDKHLVQVELLSAISDPNYYIKTLNECLERINNGQKDANGL